MAGVPTMVQQAHDRNVCSTNTHTETLACANAGTAQPDGCRSHAASQAAGDANWRAYLCSFRRYVRLAMNLHDMSAKICTCVLCTNMGVEETAALYGSFTTASHMPNMQQATCSENECTDVHELIV
jgi:hypothetical protein